MTGTRIIRISDKYDVITARVAARQIAEEAGFGLMEQVGISLATWSLAHAMDLGGSHQGHIMVDCLDSKKRRGLRVICTRQNASRPGVSIESFGDMRWLVDELVIKPLPPDQVQVTAVKWAGRRNDELDAGSGTGPHSA
jgi:hypothetical protein